MTEEKMFKLFEKYLEATDSNPTQTEEFGEKRSKRPDLHAFQLLDELVPGDTCILGNVDEMHRVLLSIDPAELAKVITEEQIYELVKCGIYGDEDGDCLFMHV